MNPTHARIKKLSQLGPVNQNVLQELHDQIYQWNENLTAGSTQDEISNSLKAIYNKYIKHLEAEKARASQEAEARSLDFDLNDETSYEYDDDDEYDL